MTPEYFTQQVIENFPEIHTSYLSKYKLYNRFGEGHLVFDIHLLCVVIINDLEYDDYISVLGIDDPLYEPISTSYNDKFGIELDFFYKYIQDNIDLIHFRLL